MCHPDDNIASLLVQAWPKVLTPMNIMVDSESAVFNPGAISDKLLSPSEVHSPNSLIEVNSVSEVANSDVSSSHSTRAVDHSTSDDVVCSLTDQLSGILVIPKSKSSGSVQSTTSSRCITDNSFLENLGKKEARKKERRKGTEKVGKRETKRREAASKGED